MSVIQLRLPKAVPKCLSKLSAHAAAGKIITFAFIAVTETGYVVDICGDHDLTSEMVIELQKKIIRRRRSTG